jgi:hypothetical protein
MQPPESCVERYNQALELQVWFEAFRVTFPVKPAATNVILQRLHFTKGVRLWSNIFYLLSSLSR